jgi:hypothetical protein
MRKVCEDVEAELKQFNGERDHVHLLINYPPRSPSPSWSTASTASPPAGYTKNSPATSTTPSCTGTCGRPRTSPPPAAERRWRSSASTSSSTNAHSEVARQSSVEMHSSPA